MAIVITDGTYYIKYTDTGATKKTLDINEAYQFASITEAIKGMKRAKGKTKDCVVYDTLYCRTLWKWMTKKEIIEVQENKVRLEKIGKIKRKTYSRETRKIIYNNAGGRCELCGQKILLDDMTLDHIKPLSMGGEDTIDNLACTCYPCNSFKGNILPDTFIERITEIYLYQMEKRYDNSLIWKVIHWILRKMSK